MTTLELDLNKSVEENASDYYDRAKKIKKKIDGAKEALEESKRKLKKLEKEKSKEIKTEARRSKKEWYEKFRWFFTSTGFLVIGGRDATTNEIIIKKHTSKNDIIFHTDLKGSPFFVVKNEESKDIDKKTLRETADATVSYSRTWKLGLSTSPVFYVKPEQVTKQAPTGEYLVKGAFVIRGKTNYMDNQVNLAIGITEEGAVMGGPFDSVKANCTGFVEIKQGNEKVSSVAKYIQKKIGGDLDEIIRALPSGGCALK